jgi:hypothetical protein
MIFPTANEGMTKWWLKVTLLCYFMTLLPAQSYCNFIKGVSAASGCCVFIGYYVFVCIYNTCHQPNLSKQFYIDNFSTLMTYTNYLLIDSVIHIVLPITTYYFWYRHITINTAIVTFVFHRAWSVVNSKCTSIYMDGSSIYNIKSLPIWGWRVVYVGEFLVLVGSTVIAIQLQT